MVEIKDGSPVWLKYQPERRKQADGSYGYTTGPMWQPRDDLEVWVQDAGQEHKPVRIDGQVRRFSVKDDQIEIECAGGVIRATPDAESAPDAGMVTARVKGDTRI